METYECTLCGIKFKRYPSTVRNPARVTCSLPCRNKKYKTSSLGQGNPNYKGLDALAICDCGDKKDTRSNKCARCAKRSYPAGYKDRLSYLDTRYDLAIPAILNSNSLSEAARACGMSRHTLTKIAKERSLNLDHMRPARDRPRSLDEVFSLKTQRDGTVRHILKALEPNQYMCECGQKPEWQGKSLTIQLDHINGNPLDDRRCNLRWLCPNCHSQTATYTGRNRSKKEV